MRSASIFDVIAVEMLLLHIPFIVTTATSKAPAIFALSGLLACFPKIWIFVNCSMKASGDAVSWLKYFATTCHVASLDCTNHSPKLFGEVNSDGDVDPGGGVHLPSPQQLLHVKLEPVFHILLFICFFSKTTSVFKSTLVDFRPEDKTSCGVQCCNFKLLPVICTDLAIQIQFILEQSLGCTCHRSDF